MVVGVVEVMLPISSKAAEAGGISAFILLLLLPVLPMSIMSMLKSLLMEVSETLNIFSIELLLELVEDPGLVFPDERRL